MADIKWGRTEERASWRRRCEFASEPWRTMRYFGLAAWPPGAETLISEAPTWHKKRGRRSAPFQGSRGRGKNVCCTAASRRKFRTSAAPKIDNTAGRGAPCERAIFLRHNPLANAGEGQYTRLVFPPPVPPTAVRPATVPPATVAPATVGPATVVATPPAVLKPPVLMAPPPG